MTTMPTQLALIVEGVKKGELKVSVSCDEPLNPDGTWFVDFTMPFNGFLGLQYSKGEMLVYDVLADTDLETPQTSQGVIDLILEVFSR